MKKIDEDASHTVVGWKMHEFWLGRVCFCFSFYDSASDRTTF